MSISREQLLELDGLKLSNINEMDDKQIDEYCKELFIFTEKFPALEIDSKLFFKSKDYNSFSLVLLRIHDSLEAIRADELAHSCRRLLEEISAKKYEVVEAHLIYLLAEISELSIDIQMVRQKSKQSSGIYVKTKSDKDTKTYEKYQEYEEQKSILAVDDVSLTLNTLRLALKDSKYKLTGVRTGSDALKFIKDHTPDLFILDIEMPEMDGYELAGKIRSAGQMAPIIFLTGNAKHEYVIKAIEAGASDFIVKPVNKDSVIEKIKKYIG